VTPVALMGLLRGAGAKYGRLWTEEGIVATAKHVVVDEADMLLTGGYEKSTKQLLQVPGAYCFQCGF
jgi:hypothetical protein